MMAAPYSTLAKAVGADEYALAYWFPCGVSNRPQQQLMIWKSGCPTQMSVTTNRNYFRTKICLEIRFSCQAPQIFLLYIFQNVK